MTTVRPPLYPPPAPRPQAARTDAQRTAGQMAFFEAAMGQAPAAARAQPQAQTQAQPPAVHVTRLSSIPEPGEAPQKILRPGSIIDIRV